MKKNIYILLLLILAIVFNGCSRKHSPYKEIKKGVMVYQISYKKASQLIYLSLTEEFPKLAVKTTKMKDGYFVDYKLMTDKQRYTITLKQLRGNINSRLIEGLSFEVFSEGTKFISAKHRKSLVNNALGKFNATLRGIIIQNAVPIRLKFAIAKPISTKNITPKRNIYIPYIKKTSHTPTNNASLKHNRVPKTKLQTLETKLEKALMLYNSGLINNHEYYNMRKKLIIKN
jgi:hypothetical protein